MLDLKFLEALVDEALANETEASLEEWLASQRNANLFSYFGSGDVETIQFSSYSFEMTPTNSHMKFSNKESDINNSCANDGLAIAA